MQALRICHKISITKEPPIEAHSVRKCASTKFALSGK